MHGFTYIIRISCGRHAGKLKQGVSSFHYHLKSDGNGIFG